MAKVETSLTAVNTVCEGTVITGNIIAKNDIRVDGELNGNLEIEGRVVIGPCGYINGDIACNNIEVLGEIKGNIRAEEIVSIKGSAKLEGNISTRRLSVDPGIIFNGSCKMLNNSEQEKKKNLSK